MLENVEEMIWSTFSSKTVLVVNFRTVQWKSQKISENIDNLLKNILLMMGK